MKSVRSRESITKLIISVILPILVITGLGPMPTRAGGLAVPISAFHSAGSLHAACSPSVTFTHKPAFGSLTEQRLYGRVDCANPTDFKLAIYIYVPGWWIKPGFTNPLTPINPDGSWQTTVVTGGQDHLATQYAAFLIPNSSITDTFPPRLNGNASLPQTLFDMSSAYLVEDRLRTIEFSGYTWKVKASEALVGPGPNYFSADPNDIWVDGSGNLHLTITAKDGKWYATEVFTEAPLGYGTYTFTLASRVDQLDKNAVLGLFTWDEAAPANNYREIDIEFSRWGQDVGDNAQYVVQPFESPGNRHRFPIALTGLYSTHSFKWEADQILFTSYQGSMPSLGAQMESWSYTGADVPPVGAGNARINLWLYNGVPPSNGQRVEVVIESFQHPTVFADVPVSHWASNYIQRLYNVRITGGCGAHPFRYCPETTVTRAQMAVFLERGVHGSSYSPPAVGNSTGFSDVPITHWAAAWIKQLAADRITGGCATGKYCPEGAVTRAQMAIFLLKAKHGSSYSPLAVGSSTGFSDVPTDHWAAKWIKQLAAEGITDGCGNGNYCPDTPVTRAQMAVFLVKTFNLP